MENEQLYDKIGVFLSNAMQESDKANFEKEIDQNPELKAEVAQLALLKNIAQKQQTRTLIQEIHSQKMQEWGLAEEKEADLTIGQTKNNVRALGVGRTIYLWKRMSMAIAACLVFAVGYLSLSPISTPQPDMEMVTERGKDTNLSQSDKFYYEQFSLGQDFFRKPRR